MDNSGALKLWNYMHHIVVNVALFVILNIEYFVVTLYGLKFSKEFILVFLSPESESLASFLLVYLYLNL